MEKTPQGIERKPSTLSN